jgi:hypothetical protein
MRVGFLGRLSDMPLNGHVLQPASSITDIHRNHPGKQITSIIVEIKYERNGFW